MTDGLPDLSSSLSILRQHWRVLIAIASAGVVVATAWGLVQHPDQRAVALVKLPPGASAPPGPSRDVKTEVVIATSVPVLKAAGATLRPPMTPQTLKAHVRASAVGTEIVRIEARMPAGAKAVQVANAVASSFVTHTKAESAELVRGYHSTNETDAGQLLAFLALGSTEVLQPAIRTSPRSLSSMLMTDAAMALVAVVFAVLFVLIHWRSDKRLRSRDEIANAVGAPILGSLVTECPKNTAGWIRRLNHEEPCSPSTGSARRILVELLRSPPDRTTRIDVLTFAGDRDSACAAVDIALTAAEQGIPTGLVLTGPDSQEPVAKAVAAAGTQQGGLVFGADLLDPSLEHVQLLLNVMVVDAHTVPTLDSGADTILVVSPGAASIDLLTRVAHASHRPSRGIAGVILVNSDPDDTSAGLSPARLHLALAGIRRTNEDDISHATSGAQP